MDKNGMILDGQDLESVSGGCKIGDTDMAATIQSIADKNKLHFSLYARALYQKSVSDLALIIWNSFPLLDTPIDTCCSYNYKQNFQCKACGVRLLWACRIDQHNV